MGRGSELVKRHDRLHPEAAVHQDFRVASETCRVAGDGDDEGQGARRELPRLRLRSGARRIEQSPVERGEFVCAKRSMDEIAGFGDQPAQILGRGRPALERRDRRRVGIGGVNLAAAREAQGEGARAAKEVRDLSGLGKRGLREFGQPFLASLGRLQKAARRKFDESPAEGDARRAALDDDRAMVGDAREVQRVGGSAQLAGFGQFERPRSAQVDVEPVRGWRSRRCRAACRARAGRR